MKQFEEMSCIVTIMNEDMLTSSIRYINFLLNRLTNAYFMVNVVSNGIHIYIQFHTISTYRLVAVVGIVWRFRKIFSYIRSFLDRWWAKPEQKIFSNILLSQRMNEFYWNIKMCLWFCGPVWSKSPWVLRFNQNV